MQLSRREGLLGAPHARTPTNAQQPALRVARCNTLTARLHVAVAVQQHRLSGAGHDVGLARAVGLLLRLRRLHGRGRGGWHRDGLLLQQVALAASPHAARCSQRERQHQQRAQRVPGHDLSSVRPLH